jgi:hypothetical protein
LLVFKYLFWGDIDMGGFRIFDHLSSTVLPDLQPYRMDEATFLEYIKWAELPESEYLKKLGRLYDEERFSSFKGVINLMLTHKKRLEQEGLLL